MKKLLYITPEFPPSNALGSRRALNIVRHIGRDDWQPVVLTSTVSELRNDPQLESLVPDNLLLYRQFNRRQAVKPVHTGKKKKKPSPLARWLEQRGPYYIPFDEHMWNLPHAFRISRQLVRKHRPDLILVNADPWSGLLLGHKLSKWSGIPWIADLRDPWSLHAFKMQLRPAIIRSVIRYYESMFFHSASRVVLNSQQCCEAYRAHFAGSIDSSHLTWIRNAFDRGIYRPPTGTTQNRIFSLHYFGSFRIYADPDPLFQLLSAFIRKHNLSPAEIELVLYGEQRPRDMNLAAETGLHDYIRICPSVSVRDAMINLETASLLMLVEGPNRKLQLPVKLYDYLACGKPILALSDNPELNMILHTTSSGLVADYHNLQDGVDKLDQLYSGAADGQLHFISGEIENYAVDQQIRDFTRLFNEVLEDDL
ncbi:MAG TPA: glycosyltransferase [Gammaproteobacteria bacterium]|nr:glycosyltransferase [Gammaproteobacteria bacterium]